jgi:hypothetical protein
MAPQQQRVEERWPLPPGWSWVPLETVADIEGGHAKATKAQAHAQGTIPLIQSGDLHNSKAITITRYVTEEEYARLIVPDRGLITGYYQQKPVKKLLLAVARETMGRIGILDAEKAVFNHAVLALTPKAHIRLDYLFYYFLMESTRLYIREKVAPGPRSFTGGKVLGKKMLVPLPPLDQGNSLALQDHIIERIEALTGAARQAQQRLVTMRTDMLDAFSSLLGQLFASHMAAWPRVPLRELVEVRTGQRYRGQSEYRQAPCITASTIMSAIGIHAPYSPAAGSRSEEEGEGERYVLRSDGATVLYAGQRPEARRAVMLDQELAICSGAIIALSIRDRTRLLPSFLLYSLLAPQFTRFTLVNADGTGIPTVSSDVLLSYALPLPEPGEQEGIINYLHNNRQLIESAQASLARDASAIERAQSAILEKAFQGGL